MLKMGPFDSHNCFLKWSHLWWYLASSEVCWSHRGHGAVLYCTWHLLPHLLYLPLQHYFHFVLVNGWQNFCQPSLLFLWYLHLVWLQMVCQCYLMLAKQRDLLKLHKPPQSKDKLKDQDLKVSMAAGSLFGDRASLMSARYMINAVQSVNSALAYHWCLESVWEKKPYAQKNTFIFHFFDLVHIFWWHVLLIQPAS